MGQDKTERDVVIKIINVGMQWRLLMDFRACIR